MCKLMRFRDIARLAMWKTLCLRFMRFHLTCFCCRIEAFKERHESFTTFLLLEPYNF